ncbi:hypothetical protein MA20_22270 [Bradyrhizobium japonicum]|uniref:SIR2-like domain-containing protein n=1 Tax=Bradyrhizobium japonicum TaxID=375 RepID=A0A0A3XVW6_BRAJP|nr:hypothetical protein [Bradyrhizobium japonicum]KGT77321.1 hypothetical protein MA20_22270 [Bradyrhizobium japonicum]
MFNRKTLFIIGAGAGADIGMPVGAKLALDIHNRTKIAISHFGTLEQGTFDYEFARAFFQAGRGADRYSAAFDLIHRGIFFANSIDDFLSIHEGSAEVVEIGKAAIVRAILLAEKESHLYVDPSNAYNTLDLMKVHTSWLTKLMRVLGPGRKAPDVQRVLDEVTFINFNYDRCLEHFLTHALSLQYGITLDGAKQIVGGAKIIHPYGMVGGLDRVPFGGREYGGLDYVELSKQIKTYTERVEEESTLFSMHNAIRDADCIVFLGFAYHSQNMDLLFDKHAPPRKTVPIFGTALGMSKSDASEVSSFLMDMFPEYDPDDELEDEPGAFGMVIPRPLPFKMNNHVAIEREMDCGKLFDSYSKSIAGYYLKR